MPNIICGTFFAISSIDGSAAFVRKANSIAVTPPRTNALATGIASSSESISRTAMIQAMFFSIPATPSDS
jgi:hypothetical protein